MDQDGKFTESLVSCRYKGDFPRVKPEKVEYMDVSPKQLVSVAAALIPFLEHDDANRALMGSNMQRQSVPLMIPEVPLVGTGMEEKVARDSGVVVLAHEAGTVTKVDGREIVDRQDGLLFKEFSAFKRQYLRASASAGQTRPEGGSRPNDRGRHRHSKWPFGLGRNALVAFMPWRGYNFEDAILINERIVREDAFTSIHIERFECECRETRLGNEEITRDIPNVAEEALKDLTEEGIVRVGAEVKATDILVGKVTPKSEKELVS